MEGNNRNQEKVRTNGHSNNEDHVSNIGRSDTSSNAPGDGNKQILVPLDGSLLAEMALPHAIALARATSSGLLLMRVVPPLDLPLSRIGPIGSMGPMYYESTVVDELYDDQPALARDYLQGVVERLVTMNLPVEASVTDGIPEDVIAHYAQEHPEVLVIAMSTHGRSGVGRWLFGSVAEKVLHGSPVPVLLVRPGEESAEKEILDPAAIPLYKTLLVPLDGSLFAEEALDQAQPLARALDARLVLLSVASTPFDLKLVKRAATADWSVMPRSTQAVRMVEYLDGITRRLATANVAAQAQVTYGDRVDEILDAVRFADADLIVMATHGFSSRGYLMAGSVAMSVAQTATIPLLLVRAAEHKHTGREEGVRSALQVQESESSVRR
jgi:nucleotide-binding universal stress UspA family protein